jgi:uncharacterized membrane protein YgcG
MNRADRWKQNLPQLLAMVILVAAIFTSAKRAIFPMMIGVLRVAWPFLLVWFAWRYIKGKMTGYAAKLQQELQKAASSRSTGFAGGGGATGTVIDLCPKCGTLLAQGHSCADK